MWWSLKFQSKLFAMCNTKWRMHIWRLKKTTKKTTPANGIATTTSNLILHSRLIYCKVVKEATVFRFQQIPFHHFGFIAAFAQAVQPLFPSFIPRTYQFVNDPFSLQISNQKIFTIMEDLSTTSNSSCTPTEICDALEYAIVCSHGMLILDKSLIQIRISNLQRPKVIYWFLEQSRFHRQHLTPIHFFRFRTRRTCSLVALPFSLCQHSQWPRRRLCFDSPQRLFHLSSTSS